VIGIIAWSKSYLFISSKVRFHVEALVVDKRFRRLGIAKKLLNYLEKIAKNHSPSIVDLTSGLRRVADGTHSFYDMLGYCNEGKMAKLYLRKEF
jgi:GNAT superfamily N-acetyltransferase